MKLHKQEETVDLKGKEEKVMGPHESRLRPHGEVDYETEGAGTLLFLAFIVFGVVLLFTSCYPPQSNVDVHTVQIPLMQEIPNAVRESDDIEKQVLDGLQFLTPNSGAKAIRIWSERVVVDSAAYFRELADPELPVFVNYHCSVEYAHGGACFQMMEKYVAFLRDRSGIVVYGLLYDIPVGTLRTNSISVEENFIAVTTYEKPGGGWRWFGRLRGIGGLHLVDK